MRIILRNLLRQGMRVIDNLDEFEAPDFSVVTIGTFDGVHRGHQTILKTVVKEAAAHQGKSILITFWPHPRFILRPDDKGLKLLSTFEEKEKLIQKIGIDYLIKLQFTPAFSSQSADEFVRKILIEGVGAKKLFIGYDHHFGRNREGNIDFLKAHAAAYGFEVAEIPRQDIDSIGVSSTKIRNAVSNGEIPLANTLLGRVYSLVGKVIHGDKRGRTIGFPTANIEAPASFKLLPKDGVYAVKVEWKGSEYPGMLNIGFKPTLGGENRSIEVHLFNFDAELYGEKITIKFIDFIRSEIKFASLEELRGQLEEDKANAMSLLR